MLTNKQTDGRASEIISLSHVARLVGCWTHNPRVVGLIPTDPNCFMWDNILGQDIKLDCPSLHPGEKYGYPAIRDTGFCALHGSNR